MYYVAPPVNTLKFLLTLLPAVILYTLYNHMLYIIYYILSHYILYMYVRFIDLSTLFSLSVEFS